MVGRDNSPPIVATGAESCWYRSQSSLLVVKAGTLVRFAFPSGSYASPTVRGRRRGDGINEYAGLTLKFLFSIDLPASVADFLVRRFMFFGLSRILLVSCIMCRLSRRSGSRHPSPCPTMEAVVGSCVSLHLIVFYKSRLGIHPLTTPTPTHQQTRQRARGGQRT